MKCSLIKNWRRHVNDTKCSHVRGLHFPLMRLLHIIDLKIGISLKDLDYRVTSP
jgi:hypothetical protein